MKWRFAAIVSGWLLTTGFPGRAAAQGNIIENQSLRVTFNPPDATWTVLDKNLNYTWTQVLPSAYQPSVRSDVKYVLNSQVIYAASAVSQTGNQITATLSDPSIPKKIPISFSLTLTLSNSDVAVDLTPQGSINSSKINYPYPFAIDADQGHIVLPQAAGLLLPTNDLTTKQPPSIMSKGMQNLEMRFFGVTDLAKGYVAILETPWDGDLELMPATFQSKSIIAPIIIWEGPLKKLPSPPDYTRRVTYSFSTKGGHVAIAKRFRQYVQTHDAYGNTLPVGDPRVMFKTLRRKIQENPKVAWMLGSAMTSLGPTLNQKPGIINELEDMGLTRMSLEMDIAHDTDDSLQGIQQFIADTTNRQHLVRPYTIWDHAYDVDGMAAEVCQSAQKKAIAQANLCSTPDLAILTYLETQGIGCPGDPKPDVFQRFLACHPYELLGRLFLPDPGVRGGLVPWTDGQRWAGPGAGCTGGANSYWQGEGLNFSFCSLNQGWAADFVALKLNKVFAKYPFTAIFNDVEPEALNEDYHPTPVHDRRVEMAETIQKIQNQSQGLGLIVGGEGFRDWASAVMHYTPDLMSMRMYSNDPDLRVDETLRIPLAELVYHDAYINAGPWDNKGLTGLYIKEKRILFSLLYGTSVGFSPNKRNYASDVTDFLNQFYYFWSPWHQTIGLDEMLSHEFLTPDLRVQQSAFSSGWRIIANFNPPGGPSYQAPDGHPVAPLGYYKYQADVTPPALSFHTVTPCRIADTRNPDEPEGGPALVANENRNFQVAGQCGVSSTAKAAALNVTVTTPTAAGSLRLYPGDSSPPATSTISYSAGQTRANNAMMGLGAAGDLGVRCDQTSGTVHVILDVVGWFE